MEEEVEPPPGFEPGTSALPGRRSDQLSYGGNPERRGIDRWLTSFTMLSTGYAALGENGALL